MQNTRSAKSEYIKTRVNVPTTMTSKAISESPEFNAKVRAHCFFSARVAQSRILDRIRHYSDQYSSGKTDKNSARASIKKFLRREGFSPDGAITDDKTTDHSLTNLASTARLNLILNQNKLMATSIGRKEEINRLGAPLQRYVPSWKRDKRDSHKKFYDTILPVDHAFWDTHTPPLDFNCGCSIEPVWDDEEAAEFGGVDTATPINEEKNVWKLKNNNDVFKVETPRSGFVFDSAAPFEEFDASVIENPAFRAAVIDEAEVIFGDQISRSGDILKMTPKKYKTWETMGLASAKTWKPLQAPTDIQAVVARKKLENEFQVSAADGTRVVMGKGILKHWDYPQGKLKADIDGRLKKLDWAVTTLQKPREIWEQKTQKGFFQIFKKNTGGMRACLVFVKNNSVVNSYFFDSVSRLNKARKGMKIIKTKK